MKYDFTTILDRRGHDAISVDGLGKMPGFTPDAPREGFDPIPMWIADMSFPTAPSIVEAMRERLDHPCFGYFQPTDAYFDSIINWHKVRNGVQGLLPEHIGYENGVLGGVVSALNVVCSRGDKVLVHSPTYIGFTMSLKNSGYDIVHSPLHLDENNVWRMDFEDMEKKLREGNIHAAIMCNPHNPCGRVWERWELEKAMELYKKYDVYVVSDEIWSDLMMNGHKHIPTQSVSEDARQRTAAFYAPSKTFSLAGLIGSYHIVYNKWWRDRINKESSLCHYNSMNVLSMHALVGAYKPEGQAWLDELRRRVIAPLEALRKAPEWEDTLVHGGFQPAFQEETEIFAYWRIGAVSRKRILVLCHYGRGTVSVPFEEPFRVLLNNGDGLESREGRLWLHTYQVVVLACGAGEEEKL